MRNFKYKNPTKIIFGKGEIESLTTEIPKASKILMLYGGGSIKKNGIYSQIKEVLKEYELLEFSGISSNPEYDTLLQAVEVIKSNGVNFLLAVGGGSVIDATKFVAAAALYNEGVAWSMLTQKRAIVKAIPFGTVLTLPATGSEMNSTAVITNKEKKEKLVMSGPALYPLFSILNPEVVSTLPKRQRINGIADAFSHVLEQYITYPVGALLQDRFAESILQTLIEIAPTVIKDPLNYQAASDFMWCCTMALNGQIQLGVPADWASHVMGHELTALYNIDHARTIAIILPNHYRYNFESKKEKLAQYAERIWDINEGSLEDKAKAGIEKTEEFYLSLGIETKLSHYTQEYAETPSIIQKRFEKRGLHKLGENRNITPLDVKKILEMCL